MYVAPAFSYWFVYEQRDDGFAFFLLSTSLQLSRIAFASECDELVARVRLSPKRLAPGTGRVTERDWLAYCARLWHSLATSAALAEHRGTR